jgi:hypothetical protein
MPRTLSQGLLDRAGAGIGGGRSIYPSCVNGPQRRGTIDADGSGELLSQPNIIQNLFFLDDGSNS